MTDLATRECTCKHVVAMSQKRPERCEHGNYFLSEKQLKAKPRKPLPPKSKKRLAEEESGQRKKHRNGLDPGKGFQASPAQRTKVKGLPCLACRREGNVDPAHVWRQAMGGCDHPDCVIPLCRSCHNAFDLGELDLLPILADSEAWAAEQAHPIAEHGVGLVELVRRLGGNETEVVSTAAGDLPLSTNNEKE